MLSTQMLESEMLSRGLDPSNLDQVLNYAVKSIYRANKHSRECYGRMALAEQHVRNLKVEISKLEVELEQLQKRNFPR